MTNQNVVFVVMFVFRFRKLNGHDVFTFIDMRREEKLKNLKQPTVNVLECHRIIVKLG